MGVCNCSMFCCTLLYIHSSIAIILMGKRELIALLNLSSWCLVMVERLFLAMPRGCLQFVIVVFPDHTHLLFLKTGAKEKVDICNRQIQPAFSHKGDSDPPSKGASPFSSMRNITVDLKGVAKLLD